MAIFCSSSAVNTERVSVWEMSMDEVDEPTTVTAPNVVVPSFDAAAKETSVPLAILTVTFSRTAIVCPSFCRLTL